jgi:hypothetical protein
MLSFLSWAVRPVESCRPRDLAVPYQGGQLETMAYTNLGDPPWDCYRALTGA